MRFDQAQMVDQIAYEMRLADYPRSLDRARINDLFNGVPPYTQQEAQENGIEINVNFLEGTRLAHDARSQFTANFMKPGRFFTCQTDMGPVHKRSLRSNYVTSQIARRMKASSVYFETFRSKFALDILHGLAPSGWDTPDRWCPDAYGVEDVLVPANTLLTMKNLPFFLVYHSYTAPELKRLTNDTKRAKEAGWNLKLVEQCIEYLDSETMALSHNNWPEVWSPEKLTERVKGDGGFYAADSVPTIDCFDFYYWTDDDEEEGWCRRIILDAWSTPANSGGVWHMARNNKLDFSRNQFLFTSGKRKVASRWSNLVAFQFADLSAVAPFRYHSVRSLGYLLYAVCNLQNRLRCRVSEAVWEATLMYLRVKSLDDVQRTLKVELANRGFIDESVSFIPAAERFQVNTPLVQMGLQDNQRIIAENSSSYVSDAARLGQDRTERTKFEVMARLQQMTALIGAALQQAYRYQEFEYREIFRRFLMKDTRDPDVKSFRAGCLKYGIPEEMLVPEAWDLTSEKVMGAGNKTLEMVIAEQLMQYRPLFDPEPQREILRDVVLSITDDAARAEALVPPAPTQVTDSVHDAQLAMGSLMQGILVDLKTGINHIEYVNTMLRLFAAEVMKAQQAGGMATMQQIAGFAAIFQHLQQHIGVVAQDKTNKQLVATWGKQLRDIMNLVKAFVQRLQEQQKSQGPQIDAETQAKVQAMKTVADAKAANTRESHAQRTAQRQLQWEQEMRQDQTQGGNELQKQNAELKKQLAELRMQLSAKTREHGMNLAVSREEHLMGLQRKRAEDRMDLRKRAAESAIDVAAARQVAKSKPKGDDNA